MHLQTFSDGGQSPKPCFGFVVRDDAGLIVDQRGKVLPVGTTSNEAEWYGMLAGLYRAKALGAKTVTAHADSQLVVRQATGQYAVRAENLIEFRDELGKLVEEFDHVDFVWIPRERNTLADALGREACEQGS